MSSAVDPWANIKADGSTPSQSAAAHEEQERIYSLRRKKEEHIHAVGGCLSEQQLQVFKLREAWGRPLKTIAADLNLTAVETARFYYQAWSLLQGKVPYVDESADATTAEVRRLLSGLPDRQRQAVELRHVERYKLEEIGEVLDCPLGAVGAVIYRGMRTIKFGPTGDAATD